MTADLPFVDEHSVTVAASRQAVWSTVLRFAEGLGLGERNPLAQVWGTQPRSGFAISHQVDEESIDLSGRHRFSRYRLVFVLSDGPPGKTVVTARTFAVFPGVHGRLYRAAVIHSRAHAVITRRLLRVVARRAEIRA